MGTNTKRNMFSKLFSLAAVCLVATALSETTSDDWQEAVDADWSSSRRRSGSSSRRRSSSGSSMSECSNLGARSPTYGSTCDATDLCNLMMEMDLKLQDNSLSADQKEYYSAYKVKTLGGDKGTVFSFGTMGEMARNGQTKSVCARKITTASGAFKNQLLRWITVKDGAGPKIFSSSNAKNLCTVSRRGRTKYALKSCSGLNITPNTPEQMSGL